MQPVFKEKIIGGKMESINRTLILILNLVGQISKINREASKYKFCGINMLKLIITNYLIFFYSKSHNF